MNMIAFFTPNFARIFVIAPYILSISDFIEKIYTYQMDLYEENWTGWTCGLVFLERTEAKAEAHHRSSPLPSTRAPVLPRPKRQNPSPELVPDPAAATKNLLCSTIPPSAAVCVEQSDLRTDPSS
jgi:hypothetical protein